MLPLSPPAPPRSTPRRRHVEYWMPKSNLLAYYNWMPPLMLLQAPPPTKARQIAREIPFNFCLPTSTPLFLINTLTSKKKQTKEISKNFYLTCVFFFLSLLPPTQLFAASSNKTRTYKIHQQLSLSVKFTRGPAAAEQLQTERCVCVCLQRRRGWPKRLLYYLTRITPPPPLCSARVYIKFRRAAAALPSCYLHGEWIMQIVGGAVRDGGKSWKMPWLKRRCPPPHLFLADSQPHFNEIFIFKRRKSLLYINMQHGIICFYQKKKAFFLFNRNVCTFKSERK